MTSCRPPSFSTFSCQLTAHSWQLSSLWRLTIRRHSEWTQECCLRKTGNGIVTRSEESITLNDVLPAFLTTTADPSHSFRMTFYRPLSLRTGGRKRIFILFFCVVPPSQYPPSGFAGHLLINKEAYPIPIFSVRIPFLNTVADPSLALWMTPYRIPSFSTFSCQLTAHSW